MGHTAVGLGVHASVAHIDQVILVGDIPRLLLLLRAYYPENFIIVFNDGQIGNYVSQQQGFKMFFSAV